MVTSPVPARLPTLTGARFLAAFAVFFSHAVVTGYLGPEAVADLLPFAFSAGWAGVEFFFILSGFVLTWSARAEDTKARFVRRRLAKVFPLHVVTWAAAAGLALWAGQALTAKQLVPSLFLVHTWQPDLETIRAVNVPSWSLGVELLFYLAFPWIKPLVDRIPARRLWAVATGLAAVTVALPAIALGLVPGEPKIPGLEMSLAQNWFLVSLPPVRLLDFVLGIVLARIVLSGRWIRLGVLPILGLVAAGFAAEVLLFPTVWGLTAPLVVPLALLIAASAAADVRGAASPLRTRPLVWLGDISFALYLVHYPILEFSRGVLFPEGNNTTVAAVVTLGGLLAVSIGVAWLLHVAVEKPGMRLLAAPRARTPVVESKPGLETV
ncbi:acyltransferase [Actinokineospora sp. NBRC 105648]|uniref:acyltransferase family protein n=1 Tax=Actinokineospora sp. NBRC 105648 TaxID=3032206 RepID=UPI0024A3C322|nr:acyltransferase [Actinokineospora sp. NBRC 105648]GLZ40808.1 acyltransferase [Actinokineospora sp. NBRC 105648]